MLVSNNGEPFTTSDKSAINISISHIGHNVFGHSAIFVTFMSEPAINMTFIIIALADISP